MPVRAVGVMEAYPKLRQNTGLREPTPIQRVVARSRVQTAQLADADDWGNT
jgi:hypothetical protein